GRARVIAGSLAGQRGRGEGPDRGQWLAEIMQQASQLGLAYPARRVGVPPSVANLPCLAGPILTDCTVDRHVRIPPSFRCRKLQPRAGSPAHVLCTTTDGTAALPRRGLPPPRSLTPTLLGMCH